jgi:hypothetical protein
VLSAVFLALTLGAAGTGFQQCAVIKDDAARLACYDALARQAPAHEPAAAPPAESFGLPPKPAQPEVLEARVVGALKYWQRGTLVKLDNGQVWKIQVEERSDYPNLPDNPEVTIRRRWFGAYEMEIKAIRRRMAVQRVS